MSPEIIETLKQYLLDHEFEIAVGVNDFGELVGVFEEIVGWYPQTGDEGYVL